MDSQLPKVVIANNLSVSVSFKKGTDFLFNTQYRREGMKKLLGVMLGLCLVCSLYGQAGAQETSGNGNSQGQQQWQARQHERQELRQKMEGYRQQMEALRQQMQQEMQKVNQLREQMKSLRAEMCQLRDSMHGQHVGGQNMRPSGGQGMGGPGGGMGMNGKPMAL